MRPFLLIAVLLLLAGCVGIVQTVQTPAPQGTASQSTAVGSMTLTSPAFTEGAAIPRKYTCDAENVSPPLAWTGVPAAAKSLALIVDDPDAPAGTWVHWVVFNQGALTPGLPEGIQPEDTRIGGIQGTTSFGKTGYGGPCPPSGTHRYFFRLYALDTDLPLKSNARAGDVRSAMQGHVLAEATLMGRYSR